MCIYVKLYDGKGVRCDNASVTDVLSGSPIDKTPIRHCSAILSLTRFLFMALLVERVIRVRLTFVDQANGILL